MSGSHTLPLLSSYALLLTSALAHAQERPNAQAAQLLFDEAKQHVERGDYASACPMFVESHKLDPAGGTILHAANCHEHVGKLATAWAEYNEAVSFARRPPLRADREQIALERVRALAPRLAKIHVEHAPFHLDYAVWLDRVRVSEHESAGLLTIPVDAGEHTLVLRAPGHQSSSKTFTIEDGDEITVIFPALRPLPKNDEPEPTPTRRPPEEPQLRKKSVATTNGMSAGAIAGLSLGAVGVAGLIVGTVFGVRAVTIGDQSERCTLGPAGTGCPRAAVDRQDDARQAGTAATVSFAIGGALLAGGVTLFLLAPRAKSAPRTMQLRVGNPLSIAGVF